MITGTKPVRVMIVDDSAVVRKVLSQQLNSKPGIEVISSAPDPFIARDKIVSDPPDVIILDVEMPKMDGITFLGKIMQHHPLAVIIFSSLTPEGSSTAAQALALGAVDVVSKPGPAYSVGDAADDLAEKIIAASRANIRQVQKVTAAKPPEKLHMAETTNKIIAIGASTGGVQTLTKILAAFPANCPPTIIVQHMPPKFTADFARTLDRVCPASVTEAKENDSVLPGRILIAPGGMHMLLRRSGAKYYVTLKIGPKVCRQMPSVEVMFNSVAKYAGANAVGAILTGMGDDGAQGLLNMKNNGAKTFAQDESSSIVYGMPKEAVKLNAATQIISLDNMAQSLINACRK